MERIYLDVCCWNRPFDDQTQTRIHLEAEAVLAIVTEVERGRCQLLHSDVVDLEIDDTADAELRQRLRLTIPGRHRYVRCNSAVVARASWRVPRNSNGLDSPALTPSMGQRRGGRGGCFADNR